MKNAVTTLISWRRGSIVARLLYSGITTISSTACMPYA